MPLPGSRPVSPDKGARQGTPSLLTLRWRHEVPPPTLTPTPTLTLTLSLSLSLSLTLTLALSQWDATEEEQRAKTLGGNLPLVGMPGKPGMRHRARTPDYQTPGEPASRSHAFEPRRGQAA